MVETIKRKKSDLFNTKIGAFLGNNKFFLFALRIVGYFDTEVQNTTRFLRIT